MVEIRRLFNMGGATGEEDGDNLLGDEEENRGQVN
jgi:hypothetical protein